MWFERFVIIVTSLHRDFINESDAAEPLRNSAEQARLAERQAVLDRLGRSTKLSLGLAIALLIVAAMFLVALVYALRPGNREKFEAAARAPLRED